MFTITMETPGSAPWAEPPRGGVWRAVGPSAQLPPVGRTRRFQQPRRSRLARSPLDPVPQHPGAAAPGARPPAPLPAAGVTASRFPHGTPPSSPGRHGAVLLPTRSRKDAMSAAGRGRRGWRPEAGPRGRHCDANVVEPGIGWPGAGQGRARGGGQCGEESSRISVSPS